MVRARPIWFNTGMLISLGEVLVAVLEDKNFSKRLVNEKKIPLAALIEMADKLRREIDKL